MPSWLHAGDYWIARLLIQRGLGVIYLIAFCVALEQGPALIGENGLMPVPRFLEYRRFRDSPSLFFWRYSDKLFTTVCAVGIGLALVILSGLPDHAPIAVSIAVWLVTWALYLSIVNVGQTFYSFGWETLLLEAGFLAAFLGPGWTAVPAPIIWLFRWMLFRVEFGAGLIKLRNDPCWRDFTCLYYHHETQPMPNPLSWRAHNMPRVWHRIEVAGSHFAQLVAPVLLFLPQPIASFGGLVMIGTQSWLVMSGSYAWLNWITMLLGVSAVSDQFYARLFHVVTPTTTAMPGFDVLVILVAVAIIALSYRPARNLFQRDQMMNASFEPLHLVNTYGAFGSVTRHRREVVVEGTGDNPLSDDAKWIEYEFRGKPTDPRKRPPQWAPYHLRLDWLLWFVGISPGYGSGWFRPLIRKLLENDPAITRQLARNPFPDKPPRAIRAVMYEYRFTTPKERKETGEFWVRRRLGELLPPAVLPENSELEAPA